MEITELDELSKLQLDPTQHFELIRVVHLASTRLDLAPTLGGYVMPIRVGDQGALGYFGNNLTVV